MNLFGVCRKLFILFGTILLVACCEKQNTAPVAKFIFTPASGAMDTVFTFDASGSSDAQDNPSYLEVRWDWEADGIWDTDYSTEKIAGHRFKIFTENAVILEVKDSRGLTGTLKKTISISDQGTITGMDPRMCICCGGWWIRLQNDTLRFFEAPVGSEAILENAVFPLPVRVKWSKKIPRCLGDEILIYDLSRE